MPRIPTFPGSALALLIGVFLSTISGCVSPQVETRLQKLEAKQDSLIKMIATMKEQSEFVAYRVGWRPPPDTTPQQIPVGSSPVQGAANALLTLVEFSDLECPYCAQVAPILDSVAKAYPNEVKVVFKHFPLERMHPRARQAAKAAECAGKQGKFWDLHTLLFEKQNEWAVDSDAGWVLKYSQALGLDTAPFFTCLNDPAIDELINADVKEGNDRWVGSTPTFFVNGKRFVGARQLSTLGSLWIEKQLKK